MAPKVFISYSGDDSERFVEQFAGDLRRHGVDAWYAGWEIRPGDSLVDRIFDDGLPNAEAVIVVLSETSVQKPWVREELNYATVKRIEERIRLIPVKIEECTTPEPLRTLKRVNFSNLAKYQERLQEVVDVLFDRSSRPPLGQAPPYTTVPTPTGYSQLEWTVLGVLGEMSWELTGDWLNVKDAYSQCGVLGLESSQVSRTLDRLEARHLVEGQKYASGEFGSLRLTTRGAGEYCRSRVPNYHEQKRRFAAYLASFDSRTQLLLTPEDGMPPLVFRAAVNELAASGLIKSRWIPHGNRVDIFDRSPLLEDWIEAR